MANLRLASKLRATWALRQPHSSATGHRPQRFPATGHTFTHAVSKKIFLLPDLVGYGVEDSNGSTENLTIVNVPERIASLP